MITHTGKDRFPKNYNIRAFLPIVASRRNAPLEKNPQFLTIFALVKYRKYRVIIVSKPKISCNIVWIKKKISLRGDQDPNLKFQRAKKVTYHIMLLGENIKKYDFFFRQMNPARYMQYDSYYLEMHLLMSIPEVRSF